MPNISKEPENISELIAQVNLLPFDIDLPVLSSKTSDIGTWPDAGKRYSRFSKPYEQWTERATDELLTLQESLYKNVAQGSDTTEHASYRNKQVKSFFAYIWGLKTERRVDVITYFSQPKIRMNREFAKVRNAVERYEGFLQLRDQFRWTIHFSQRHFSWDQQFSGDRKGKPTKQQLESNISVGGRREITDKFVLPFLGSVRFTLNTQGNLVPKADPFTEIVLSESIDVRRIRSCQCCMKVFWAKRVDSFCCSIKCNRERNQELLSSIPIEKRRANWRNNKRKNREAHRELSEARMRKILRGAVVN